ncbi:DEAD/DEAH box helicase [Methylobacterium sp. NFXW15]|uniref:DEAD/DEAH box helicase n=1 Tax=Methylobacterium sp. NFXW15 TaxID=2819512 RepID=UPI003CECB9C5
MTTTIQQTVDELRRTLTEYIEATYHIGHPGMVDQRRRLLSEVGNIHQVPFLESTPRYVPGGRYEDMQGVPAAAKEAYCRLADTSEGDPLVFNPPYSHQATAIQETLGNGRNLMVMTGTGSGKTESFLLPILGKLAIEARDRPKSFRRYDAVRAIVLYPMNALVNDQLGRLRLMFGDTRTVRMFEEWAGRPARFARYTSRTPYAGVRTSAKDGKRLATIGTFFGAIEDAAKALPGTEGPTSEEENERAGHLHAELSKRGKWPSKESVSAWFGKPGTHWPGKNKQSKRGVLRPHDAELITRHEVQENPPDLLITNYSMLEYMMLRPIERPIFDKTKEWLQDNPEEKLLIVMDEAHLYRGAQGAEVGLLLRRLRERLGIGPDRLQVICSTASFDDTKNADRFGAALTGVPRESFVPVTGTLNHRKPAHTGNEADVAALEGVVLDDFYSADPDLQRQTTASFLKYRGQTPEGDLEPNLHAALKDFAPFNMLVNETMKVARPLGALGDLIFPGVESLRADTAITSLLALGSRAKLAPDQPSLLPCRIHTFFRGLAGLWVCMDPECSALPPDERGGPAGRMYAQPHERCDCGATVLEYFTCRDCGISYARGYATRPDRPSDTWAAPGSLIHNDEGGAEALQPFDLMLEVPPDPDAHRIAVYDLMNGKIDPEIPGNRVRHVYLAPEAPEVVDDDNEPRRATPGQFVPCGCCEGRAAYNQSSVQDHQTKGDQPFQALLSTQIRIQPPGPQDASDFAPLRGRKVLIFSDSRQMAARLAPTLQTFSLRDTVRALVPAGLKILGDPELLGNKVTLDCAFAGLMVAAQRHRVRIRPELAAGETMPTVGSGTFGSEVDKDQVYELLDETCPENLLSAIVRVIRDHHLGLEALAVASVREADKHKAFIPTLPDLPGLATTPEEKVQVVRAWLRCWVRKPGIWFKGMPGVWWQKEVKGHAGKFAPMEKVLVAKGTRAAFDGKWLPQLLQKFTVTADDGGRRLLAKNLMLEFGGDWRRCETCRSVHRPISRVPTCIDCSSLNVQSFDPGDDKVFEARKGFYRKPVTTAMEDEAQAPFSLIAAEHTAQLNAAQADDAFSQAEAHEIRFQDINLAWRGTDRSEPAIDVLSSTTTMEVGIDIGALSGVALRNMPPGRANYQQRAGRAGRRGNAVATVVAFGSVDSHDDHYFVKPDEMITGPVTDPRLTLENVDIARRHVRAFIIQRYSEDRIPGVDPLTNANLFSVLGKVDEFRGGGVLNRNDFAAWLQESKGKLESALDRWLPSELTPEDRALLIATHGDDVLKNVEDAIDWTGDATVDDQGPTLPVEAPPLEENEKDPEEVAEVPSADDELADPGSDKLLDRLLYRGKLPRYAFPTDVASFHVFDPNSTSYKAKTLFAPSQGLNIALSQYAPNKQIWIKNKQYTSKAIYSPFEEERKKAWRGRKLYYECDVCHHAKTTDFDRERRNERIACEACETEGSFGPAVSWIRPPGFAHPFSMVATSQPDEKSETAYATRAKLVMSTPGDADGWVAVNDRVRAFPTRRNLLVSNTGPGEDGYVYCTACGRIEAEKDQDENLGQPHKPPYPDSDEELCLGNRIARHVVLGTDFIADICLFSIRLEMPLQLRPGNTETETALRTVCEAMAKAASKLLEIESGEILAEYRPALTPAGAHGKEVEIFLYDTLAGGAGFSPQLAHRAGDLFKTTLAILSECPECCDASCYRCLRSFKNKFDHPLLDRQLAEQLLRHALEGGIPDYSPKRAAISLDVLFSDVTRQLSDRFMFERGVERTAAGKKVTVPILATNRETGAEHWIALASPVAIKIPTDRALRELPYAQSEPIICVNDLLVRRNLPAAVRMVEERLG